MDSLGHTTSYGHDTNPDANTPDPKPISGYAMIAALPGVVKDLIAEGKLEIRDGQLVDPASPTTTASMPEYARQMRSRVKEILGDSAVAAFDSAFEAGKKNVEPGEFAMGKKATEGPGGVTQIPHGAFASPEFVAGFRTGFTAGGKAAKAEHSIERLRLDIAARFMAAFFSTVPSGVDLPTAHTRDQYSLFALAAADALLAAWKETEVDR